MSLTLNPTTGKLDVVKKYNIVNGSTEGQMAFWNGSTWTYTETSELEWNDTTKVLTFGNFPITPSSAPTTDYQVANKKYVDDNGGGVSDHDGLNNLNWASAGHTIDANVDFNKYKAIAMVCDNGATLPSTPAEGQWFLHTPTGRKILMQYANSAWQPIQSMGPMTLYVDGTNGTDDLNKGTGAGADAFATIQYAVDTIPGTVSGNVIINIASGTYSESVVIQGKAYTGNYNISIHGTKKIISSLVIGAGSLKGQFATNGNSEYPKVIRKTGTWTANEVQHKWIEMTSGLAIGEYRLIDNNTTTSLRPIGAFIESIATDDTFNIIESETTITKISLAPNQQNVYIYDVAFNMGTGTTSDILYKGADVKFIRCSFIFTGTANSLWMGEGATIILDSCFFTNTRLFLRAHTKTTIAGGKHLTGGTANTVIQVDEFAVVYICDGTIIDGGSSYGWRQVSISNINFNGVYRSITSSTFVNTIRNCGLGLSVELNAVALSIIYGRRILVGDNKISIYDSYNTSVSANKLVDSNANFTTDGIVIGDKVLNSTDNTSALVTAVDSSTQLSLDTNIFTSTNRKYKIVDKNTLNTTDFSTSTGGQI